MNGKLDGEEESHLTKMEHDPVSRMEHGNASAQNNLVSIGVSPVATMAVDDVNPNKLQNLPKSNKCDEDEQITFLQEKGLHEFNKYNSVLGPCEFSMSSESLYSSFSVSKGEFTTFTKKSEIVGCDFGVYSPISSASRSIFQTCTSNGRLLPAVPRKFFLPNDAVPVWSNARPSPYKPLTTVMLNTASANSCKKTEPCSPKSSPPPTVNPLEVAKHQNNPGYNRNKKKKNRKNAKSAAAVSFGAPAEGTEEYPDTAGNEDGDDKEDTNSSITDYELEEEEEKENEDGITEEEREARRLKNRKSREKKRVKKDQELSQQQKEPASTPIEKTPPKVRNNWNLFQMSVASSLFISAVWGAFLFCSCYSQPLEKSASL